MTDQDIEMGDRQDNVKKFQDLEKKWTELGKELNIPVLESTPNSFTDMPSSFSESLACVSSDIPYPRQV
jgi:hypothetical protein